MSSKSNEDLIFWAPKVRRFLYFGLAKKVRRFLCFGLKKERGCLCSGLPWLPAQVRLGAGSPADRMIHRAGDVFGVAVSKTYLIRILGYIRVRFFNVSQQNALMTYGVCM